VTLGRRRGSSRATVSNRFSDQRGKRLDLAARAGWLYYIKGRTQDEIATALNVSRPNAQRLVALAISEGLIKFRLDHPLLRSMELAERLTERFELRTCEVAPTEAGHASLIGIAMLAAQTLEAFLLPKEPRVVALGTGRALLEMVRQMPLIARPQHKIVSMVGNINRDGKASPYDVAMRLCDRVGAQCYPLPLPVITDTREECEFLRAQRGYQAVAALFETADAVMVGVGSVGARAPLFVDGFVDAAEIAQLLRDGAVGELVSRSFTADGTAIENEVTARLTALRLAPPPRCPVILVTAGPDKVLPTLSALRGRYATGLITDEDTAAALLDHADPRPSTSRAGAAPKDALASLPNTA
jgi:DNA-binding transcriptional regulator LsrR (DeoR family)